jgi:parvulin-like peptidyl-prolyl isomerase
MRRLLLPFVLLSAGILSGCGGSGGKTLAVVGDYKITVEEFEELVPQTRYAFPTAQDEFDRKRDVLDSLIISRLLIEAAYEIGLDKSEELARVVLANKDKFLLDVLAKKEITDKIDASEAEIRDFYNHLEYKIRASHIVVSDPDTAQALLERIMSVESFEKLAYEYSIDPSARKNKGDLGYFSWGAVVDELQETAFAMEPGEISPPIKSMLGYHIVKLVDKLPDDQRREFDAMKVDIERQIRSRKGFALRTMFFESMEKKYKITIDTTTCNYLLHKRETMYPPMLLETLPRNDFDMEQLDRNEKELVLATWDGGQMTVHEYLTQVQKAPADVRPDFDQYDSLASLIHAMNRPNVLVTEAHRSGLDSDPEYIRKVRLFKELTMADLMRNDSLPKPPPPDEGMVRQYYDEHHDEFTTPAKVHVYEILVSDELKARELKGSLTSLASFQEKALEVSERSGKRVLKGDLGYIHKQNYPDLFDVAYETPVGSIGGPVVTRSKHSIFWVVDKIEPELKDFLGSKRVIFQKLIDQQKHAAFAAWVEARKEITAVEVEEDVLWELIDMNKYSAIDSTGSSE